MTTQLTLPLILGRPIPTIQILDVGAMAVGQDRYYPLIASGLAQVTGFEPNPAEYARLQERKGPYKYLPAFLGNGAPATFHLTDQSTPGCPNCDKPMRFTRSMPALGRLPELQTFECRECGVVMTEPAKTEVFKTAPL